MFHGNNHPFLDGIFHEIIIKQAFSHPFSQLYPHFPMENHRSHGRKMDPIGISPPVAPLGTWAPLERHGLQLRGDHRRGLPGHPPFLGHRHGENGEKMGKIMGICHEFSNSMAKIMGEIQEIPWYELELDLGVIQLKSSDKAISIAISTILKRLHLVSNLCELMMNTSLTETV